jgi:hypothetical protein
VHKVLFTLFASKRDPSCCRGFSSYELLLFVGDRRSSRLFCVRFVSHRLARRMVRQHGLSEPTASSASSGVRAVAQPNVTPMSVSGFHAAAAFACRSASLFTISIAN